MRLWGLVDISTGEATSPPGCRCSPLGKVFWEDQIVSGPLIRGILSWLTIAVALATGGCGGTGGDGSNSSGVRFTRADGSLVAFPQTVRAGAGRMTTTTATPRPSTSSPESCRAASPRTRSGW